MHITSINVGCLTQIVTHGHHKYTQPNVNNAIVHEEIYLNQKHLVCLCEHLPVKKT